MNIALRMDAAPRALPRRKRLFLLILLGTIAVLLLALVWARVTENVPSTAYVVGFYGLLGIFVLFLYLLYRWTPDNMQRRAARSSSHRGADLPTPGSFAAITIILAFVFAAVAFSLAVTAYFYIAGGVDSSMVCFLATLGPPFLVMVLWMVYSRRRFVRTFLGPP